MYITNIDDFSDKYECNSYIAHWLMFTKMIPLLGHKAKKFYFADTEILREALKEMPINIRIMTLF